MSENIYHLKISELNRHAPALGTKGRAVSGACLHYCAPGAGGWGIVRIALLVPESVMLFIAPHGCGRHGSVASMQLGYRDRIFYLDVSESDLVIGTHIDRIDEVVDYILSRLPQKPKAFLICASCIDDLLASDYRGITRRLTKKHGIPFGEVHMNPITMSSSAPPALNVQRSIYRFLWDSSKDLRDPSKKRTPGRNINLIGHYSAVDPNSELYPLLQKAGFENIRQVSGCRSFKDFLKMKDSVCNILLKPFGRLAAADMERELGIPCTKKFIRYRAEGVADSYRELEEFLDLKLDYRPYYMDVQGKIEAYRARLRGLRIAIGEEVNGSAFELACALAEYGARIAFIISSAVADYEWEYVERLQRIDPAIPVYTSYHPTMAMIGHVGEKADLAIGFDASYICQDARLMILDNDEQHYGFEAVTALLDGIDKAMAANVSARSLLYSKALVV